jgi:hypothetical protein
MTFQEFIEFYETKPEHLSTSISDCFIQAGYQQKRGGYIACALKVGKVVD